MIVVEKYIMITLADSNRASTFYSDIPELEYHAAIDTRIDPLDVCKQHGWSVDIHPRQKKYFDRANGAYGCSMSHLELYKKIAKLPTGNYYCVLEDDACPTHLKKHMSEQNHDYPDKPIINILQDMSWKDSGDPHVGPYCSTGAYLITPEMCRLILKIANNTITHPSDVFIWRYVKHFHPDMYAYIQYMPKLKMWNGSPVTSNVNNDPLFTFKPAG